MNTANPSSLRVGATGALHGWKVTVAGRLVLAVEIDGETYTWNEFHLVGETGNDGTLAFEETEQGPEWKLFRLFEPAQPMSAAEAAAKRVGDTVSLDGKPNRVTLVDESRVVHIEGTAPEGVEVGDTAHYFNVDTGRRMLVASWTGDEIEFYEGEDVPAALVAQAFGLPAGAGSLSGGASASAAASGGIARSPLKLVLIVAAVLVAGAIAVALFASSRSRARPPSQVRQTPPAPPALQLRTGAFGRLGPENFLIAGSATVDVARVRGRQSRREYQLSGDTSASRILVQGLTGQPREWHLLRPLPSPPPLDPYQAAAQRKNARVDVAGKSAVVTELFLAKAISREGTTDALPASGLVRYGFVAQAPGGESIVARWDESGVQWHAAVPYVEADVRAAFTALEAVK